MENQIIQILQMRIHSHIKAALLNFPFSRAKDPVPKIWIENMRIDEQKADNIMNRLVDYETLRNQNFQLKNQITDLKNAFDLNRDVLKILQQQSTYKHPSYKIFYQIISRLTGINNQIMLSNIELLQDKNKLKGENKKMQNTIDNLSIRINQLVSNVDCVSPKEIQMQMRDQMKELRVEILALNEDCIRKKLEINRLTKIIKEKQAAEQKKPIIPTLPQTKLQTETPEEDDKQIENISKKFETQGTVSKLIIQKNIEGENRHLKRLVEELEYRLTLLSRIYDTEPFIQRDFLDEQDNPLEPNFREVGEKELNLLMFALNNTKLMEDAQTHSMRVTVTNRCKFGAQPRNLIRSSSSIL